MFKTISMDRQVARNRAAFLVELSTIHMLWETAEVETWWQSFALIVAMKRQ